MNWPIVILMLKKVTSLPLTCEELHSLMYIGITQDANPTATKLFFYSMKLAVTILRKGEDF